MFGAMRDRYVDYCQVLELRLLGGTMLLRPSAGRTALACSGGSRGLTGRTPHGIPICLRRMPERFQPRIQTGLAGDLVARLGEKVQRLLNPNWLLFRSSETVDELIVARHGPVEIRQTLAGWTLETRVKGEPDRARATALRRLGNYVNGRNRSGTRLRVARPLVQAEEAAGRWHIRIALPGMDSDFAAATKAQRQGQATRPGIGDAGRDPRPRPSDEARDPARRDRDPSCDRSDAVGSDRRRDAPSARAARSAAVPRSLRGRRSSRRALAWLGHARLDAACDIRSSGSSGSSDAGRAAGSLIAGGRGLIPVDIGEEENKVWILQCVRHILCSTAGSKGCRKLPRELHRIS